MFFAVFSMTPRIKSILHKTIGCIGLVFCAVWYSKTHSYRDPGSAFFDAQHAYEKKYSRYRQAEVIQFTNRLRSHETHPKQAMAGENASLCVALASVARKNTQYLETTVASLLCGLTTQERADLYLTILIAEANPSNHPSWRQEWLHQVVDQVYTYSFDQQQKSYIEKLQREDNFLEKGVYDYVYALRHCFENGAPFIGMFEDDILLAQGWLVRTLIGLQQISGDSTSWLYMRLFNQERSTGWENRHIGGNHEHWIIIGIGLFVSVPAWLLYRRCRWTRTIIDPVTIFLLVAIVNPALVILFFQSGKATMLPPSPGVFNEPFGCCSQAMVFPRQQVPLLIEFLQRRQKGQIDLLLNDLAVESGLARYALYPVQAQHIGLDSARMTDKSEAQAIWSMAFEDLDPTRLNQSHQQMVSQYYG